MELGKYSLLLVNAKKFFISGPQHPGKLTEKEKLLLKRCYLFLQQFANGHQIDAPSALIDSRENSSRIQENATIDKLFALYNRESFKHIVDKNSIDQAKNLIISVYSQQSFEHIDSVLLNESIYLIDKFLQISFLSSEVPDEEIGGVYKTKKTIEENKLFSQH